MVFAKKKWGQNFLVDNNLLNKIINTIEINSSENVPFINKNKEDKIAPINVFPLF